MKCSYPSDQADRFILRFEHPGHRDELKALAAREKRSLNKQILLLIEAGQHAISKQRNCSMVAAPKKLRPQTAPTVEASLPVTPTEKEH